MKVKIPYLVACIALCLGVGFVSSFLTTSSIPTWYATLNKPSFSPPNFVFAPVWTTLYILMGIALYMVWSHGMKKKKVKTAVYVFLIQLLLNFTWSLVFFGLHAPLLAFINIVLLWATLLFTIIKFYAVSKWASRLLIPYILWVSFATILNLSIVLLN